MPRCHRRRCLHSLERAGHLGPAHGIRQERDAVGELLAAAVAVQPDDELGVLADGRRA